MTSFGMVPGFLSAVKAAHTAAGAAVETGYGSVTGPTLASIFAAYGPLGVTNVIPALAEGAGNNVTSGLLTALNHTLTGVSTEVAQATYLAVDAV